MSRSPAGRLGTAAIMAVPLAFLGYFFAYPLISIVVRGFTPNGTIDVSVLGDTPVHAVFIRAPIVERTGDEVDVLARLEDGSVVAVRQRNVIATAFHPELSGDDRIHEHFLASV